MVKLPPPLRFAALLGATLAATACGGGTASQTVTPVASAHPPVAVVSTAPSPNPSGTARVRATAARDAPWYPGRVPLPEQEWDDPTSYPTATPAPGKFWVSDQPAALPPRAFGVLPPESQPRRLPVREYELAAPLPEAPTEMPVYLGGRYPDDYQAVFDRVVRRDRPGWGFIPRFSALDYRGGPLPGERAPVAGGEGAERRAAEVLAECGLLLPDYAPSRSVAEADGAWRVYFSRHIDGRAVYTKGTLQALVAPDGQVTQVLAHRRPLLSRSAYPIRTPEDAWQRLREGRGRTLRVDDGATTGEGRERFVVRAVELAYVEAEPSLPRQIVQLYYLFRGEQGTALYVPAVADPYVEWWP